MFNVTVIRLKDIIKYPVCIAIVVIAIYYTTGYFSNFKNKKIELGNQIKEELSQYIMYPIDTEIPSISNLENNSEEIIDETEENSDTEFTTYMLMSALKMQYGNIIKKEEIADVETTNDNENTEEEEKQEIEEASKDVETEIVTKNPIKETYTDKYNGVKIRNETDFELTDKILNPENLEIDASNIIIFHTHTCESYTQTEQYSYKASGNYRTTDLNYSVARVGDELTKYLTNYKFNTIHDKTYHDYPSYNGSYTRSLATVQNLLKSNESDIIIDLHRDAIGSNSDYDPTVKIGDDYCAQIMFVMGTNGGGLYHPNWNSNLQFAIKVQQKADEMYPGLFKPIILRNSRYNQHLGKAACIIEVGSTGNTLEQCLNSMKYLSKVMDEVFN